MPRSRSRSIESSTCSCISRASRPPQVWISRSASVDLPWSTCAMIEKLRICCCIGESGTPLPDRRVRGKRDYSSRRDRPRQRSREAQGRRAIEPAVADDAAVAGQHRHLEPEAPPRRRVVVDVAQLEPAHDSATAPRRIRRRAGSPRACRRGTGDPASAARQSRRRRARAPRRAQRQRDAGRWRWSSASAAALRRRP